MVSDDFAANTYYQYVQNISSESKFYMREEFMVKPYVVKSHDSHMRSILSRLLGQLAKAINENIIFLRMILFVLDYDIIRNLKPMECGATILFDKIIKWLFKEIDRMVTLRKEQLPK